MGSDSQTLQQARNLIGQRDFDGAIDLLSSVDEPSADELFVLAEAYFLKATSTEDGRKSRAAYREAVKLLPKCYADCAKPRQACREWAYSARVLWWTPLSRQEGRFRQGRLFAKGLSAC